LVRVGLPLKFSDARVVRKSESGNRGRPKVIQPGNQGVKKKNPGIPGFFKSFLKTIP
jgi:hypothetical protein